MTIRQTVYSARRGAVGQSYGAAWTWTDPLLESLPTQVHDTPPATVKQEAGPESRRTDARLD